MLLTIIQYILAGAVITIAVSTVVIPTGFFIGLGFALLRIYGSRPLSRFAAIYSTLMRGVPPVVLLFVLYFVMAENINISPFWAGSIALAIISSSYQMEILRGSIQAVGSGQMVAARAVGLSRWKAIRHVILPQALRLVIPAWSNEAAGVVKDSSLVYVIGVPEMLRRAQFVSARTYQPFLAYSIAAAIYLILVFAVNRLLDAAERRTRIPAF